MDQALMIPLVLAFTEMIKRFGVPKKFLPFVSIILGIGVSFLFAKGFSMENGLQGLLIGLSASGLWSGGKAIIKK